MLKLYNTLSRSIEEFSPLRGPAVSMYSCGPTVYDFQHIGHMRRYVGDDLLVRILQLNDYEVKHVMNITDVGHLVSDADSGEDKMEKGAKKFGQSVGEIAKKFEQQFFDSAAALHIKRPSVVIRATECIPQQIDLIKKLEEKGYTYKTDDGIYFDTSKVADYTKLSHQKLDDLRAGARVEMIPGKKNPTDFALWKFSPTGEKREMEWESPWGVGFPGWHIECSTMSMMELGETIDIHTGGIDHIMIHHTDEIAQSEAATGKEFVKFWVHHNFLMVEGEKMSKSLGNLFTVQNVIDRGYDPLSLRYLYLQTHYRQEMNFTWEALNAASLALNRLRKELVNLGETEGGVIAETKAAFLAAVNDDMNMSRGLAIVWELLKSENKAGTKKKTILWMDDVLGLDLANAEKYFSEEKIEIPDDVARLVSEREEYRKEKDFAKADEIREQIKNLGFEILDSDSGTEVKKT